MENQSNFLVALLVIVEIIQLTVFWGFVQQRYRLSLRQLARLAGDLASGRRPKSYYITGAPLIEEVARHMEDIGTRLDDLQRQQQQDDFNLNVLLANMVEGVMVVDQRHLVRLVNGELLKLFDLKQSPIGQTVLESLREARVEMIVRETVAVGQPRRQEVVLEGPVAGAERHFEISAVPVRTKRGDVAGAVLVFHDISRIKQLEMVRTEFVANVSHELRTPLAIFRGYIETLRDQPNLPPEVSQRMFLAMNRNALRLHALVEDLLALTRLESRQEPLEMTDIRVAPFFRQLLEDWHQRAGGEEAKVELQLPADLPRLEVNLLRFEQVILNLLENAVAYSNPPRRLVISARTEPGWVELRLSDNGVGIPPGDLPHIFQRFYRVDKGRSRASGGTGLGLAIVRTIIEQHHGTVHAESEFGQGTTIVVRLPAAEEKVEGKS